MTPAEEPQPSWLGGTAPSEVAEELCRVQADLLAMGEDNYQRLCRACPDPERRYRVLRTRVDHQLGTPPWGLPPHPAQGTPGPSTTALAGGVQVELEWRGQPRDADERATSPDAFVAGEPTGKDRCWRCNASTAASDLGLCEACHAALAAGEDEEDA